MSVIYLYPNDMQLLFVSITLITLLYLLLLFAMSMLIGQNFYIKAINRNNTSNVVLTFDDGPHPKYTLQILDILDEYDVKAVFFMIGKNVKAHPSIAKEVVLRGHQIGVHSQNHSNNFGFTFGKKLKAEFEECLASIEEATGIKVNLFRPPFGVTNPSIAREVKRQNLITVGWDVRSYDTVTEDPDKILKRVMKKMDTKSIILFHDKLDQTSVALPKFIEKIKGMGIAIGQLSSIKN